MGNRTIRKGIRVMSLKHCISIIDLEYWSKIRFMAFENVAEAKHYKALYTIQMKDNVSINAGTKRLLDNAEFSEKCIEYARGRLLKSKRNFHA